MLRGLSSQESDPLLSNGEPAQGAAVSGLAGAEAWMPLRKHGRLTGSRNNAEDRTNWDPKEVSVSICGGPLVI